MIVFILSLLSQKMRFTIFNIYIEKFCDKPVVYLLACKRHVLSINKIIIDIERCIKELKSRENYKIDAYIKATRTINQFNKIYEKKREFSRNIKTFVDIFSSNHSSPWHYKCDGGLCKKVLIAEQDTNPVALSVCQLSCGQAGTLWPKPTGHLSIGKTVVPLNLENIVLTGISTQTVVGNLLQRNVDRLKEGAKRLGGSVTPNTGTKLVIRFNEGLNLTDAKLTLDTDESYTLRVAAVNGQVSCYKKSKKCARRVC